MTSITLLRAKPGHPLAGKITELSKEETEKAFQVKRPEQERAQGAGLIGGASRRMAPM